MSGPNYDTYYAKHCARFYGWLPASIEYRGQLGQKPLKYFTLCAEQAIDIFMLESEGVLLRDRNRRLPNVIICERDLQAAKRILKLVRPPLEEAVLIGELEKILLFQDTAETKGRSLDKDVHDRKLRELLNVKRLSERIKRYFPFDIINFDPCRNFLYPDLEENELCQSFERILELQESANTFLLFITTPISHIHPNFEARLKSNFESNVRAYPEIRDAVLALVHTTAYDQIDENKKTALGFAKSVVISMARSKGWGCEHQGIYVYESPSRTRILNSVVRLFRPHTARDESTYIEDIVRVIRQMPEYYSHEDSLENEEVRKHLERVKQYREKIRDEWRASA
jgi:hypothetical protein